VQAGYALSDAVTFILPMATPAKRSQPGHCGVGDAFSLNPLHKYSIFQLTLA